MATDCTDDVRITDKMIFADLSAKSSEFCILATFSNIKTIYSCSCKTISSVFSNTINAFSIIGATKISHI